MNIDKSSLASRKSVLLITLILLFNLSAQSQTDNKLDSLAKITLSLPNDTLKVNNLKKLALGYSRISLEQSMKYAMQKLEVSEKLKWAYQEGRSKYLIGYIYNLYGKVDSSLIYNHEARVIFNKIGDENSYLTVNNLIAKAYATQGKQDEALEYYNESMNLATALNNQKLKASVHGGIALLNHRKGNQTLAIDHYIKAAEIHREMKDSFMLCQRLQRIGALHNQQQNIEEARTYYIESIDLAKAIKKYFFVAHSYQDMGNSYLETDLKKAKKWLTEGFEYIKNEKPIIRHHKSILLRHLSSLGVLAMKENRNADARQYFEDAQYWVDQLDSKVERAQLLSKKGLYANKIGQHKEALLIANKGLSLSETIDIVQLQKEFYQIKKEAYQNLGNYKLAFSSQEKYQELKDSILTSEKQKEALNLNFKHKYQRQHLIDSLANEKDKSILESEISKANKEKGLFITLALLLGFLAMSLFRNIKQKIKNNDILVSKNALIKKKNEQNEILLKEIHHRVKNNLQTISSLLYLHSENVSDKGAKEAITIGQQRVESMALVHKNLYQGSNLASIEMKEYILRLANNLIQSYATDGKDINVILDMEKTEMDVDTVIPLGLIINELITNALKYAFPKAKHGTLIITLKTFGDDGLSLKVKDNGIGNHNKNQGFGTKLIRLLTKQIGASYTDGNNEGYWCLIERQPK